MTSADTSIAGIVLALLLLMYLTYRGLGVLWLAPLLASLAVMLSDSPPALAYFTQVFMPALGGFVIAFFPLFLLGALFGKLMQVSGAAEAVAQAIGGEVINIDPLAEDFLGNTRNVAQVLAKALR